MTTVHESAQTTRDWFWTVPLVTSAYNTVSSVYEGARDRNALTRLTLGTVESSVKLAGRCASPIVHQLENRLEKPLSAVDSYALKKLQELEASYPVIKKPSDEVLTEGKGVLKETWENRVSQYQAVKLIGSGISAGSTVVQGVKLVGSGISAGSTVVGSTIKLSRQGINSTINAGHRGINTANELVGKGVDRCLSATEFVVKLILPEEQEKSTMEESSSSTDNAKKERHRRRQERHKRREMCRAHRQSKTWAGRLERSQDIMFTTMDRASDRVSEYLEWPIEQWWKLVKTLRMARAAATAYEMLQEYLDEAEDRLKDFNPLKTKQKINLLTETDDEEEEQTSLVERVTTSARALINLPIYLIVRVCQLTFGISVFAASRGLTISVRVYDGSNVVSIKTLITKVTSLKSAILGFVMSYLGLGENPTPVQGTQGSSQSYTVMVDQPQTSFTVMVNQQGDTPVIEDVHHSNSDHSESSNDEGSTDNDEPEHRSEDDD